MGDDVEEYLQNKDLDMAKEDLGEMIDQIEGCIKRGGFDNEDVLYLIKMWSKANVRAGLTLLDWRYWRFARDVAQPPGKTKRSQWLLRRLELYQGVLKPGDESHQLYYDSREALLNFVWEYNLYIHDDANQVNDFRHKLDQLAALGSRGLVDEDIYISIEKANHSYRPDHYKPMHRRNGRGR